MGGRGRGRGRATMSFTTEQLGLAKGEVLPPPSLLPPLDYPQLEFRAPKLYLSNELGYLVQLQRDFTECLKDSPNNVQEIIIKKDIERYSDRYQDMISEKVNYDKCYDWTRIPNELKPGGIKRKDTVTKGLKKKPKVVDVDKKLQELEKKESKQQSDDEEKEKPDDDEDEEKDPAEVVDDEEVDEDEEMDDGTDYVNNYFDNGEGYDEEDDNLDDGPTY